MNREETAKILGYIKIAYPAYASKLTMEDVKMTIGLWESMFRDDNANEVAAAVKAYIATDTSGFAPAISQIKDRLRRMHASEKELTAGAAWALVSKAADDGYYNSYKQFQKLPETVRKALGGNHQILREYSLMDVRTFESVVKSQFRREYNAVIERENESAMLPEHIRSCFPCFDDSLDIGMIGDGYENKSSDI